MVEESFPLLTADEEVMSERELLKDIEDGPYMQEVKYIVRPPARTGISR